MATERRPTSGRQTVLCLKNGQLCAQAPPPSTGPASREALASVAHETITLLPGILATRPDVKTDGYLCEKDKVAPLDPKFCPGLPRVAVRVVNCDTIDAALELDLTRAAASRPICVLNMANAEHAGGGFHHGALAQEEALCYRTSLSFTLKYRHYPIPDEAAIYSPNVLVIRNSIKDGHQLLDLRTPATLPVMSVVSAAAICRPRLIYTGLNSSSLRQYASAADKSLMEEKMRIILRTTIRNRHRQVVLGAFGCGAFGNPSEEVAAMWASVLQEQEFSGGWWEDVVFAVLDGRNDDNFRVFCKALDGLVI